MTHRSPSNALLDEVKEFVASHMPGTPVWTLFPRWTRDGTRMWVEASSRSTLATLDFTAETVTFSHRLAHLECCGQTYPMPAHWAGEFKSY